MSNGWIKIDRGITEHWIFQDAEYFRAWILILLMANHEDATVLINKKTVVIPRGSFHSSLTILAEKLHWTRNRVKRYTDLLEKEGMLIARRYTYGTTFSVVNYGKFQDVRYTDEATHEASREASRGTRVDHKQEIKNDKEGRRNARARDPHVGEDLDSVANLIKELSDAKGHI